MIKEKDWLTYLLLAPFFIGLIFVLTGATEEFDTKVFYWIQNTFAPFLDVPFKIITTLGNPKSVIAIIVILLIIPKINKTVGIPTGLITLVSWVANETAKALVSRSRPEFMLFEETSYSFPSGHAMNSMAMYLGLLFSLLLIVKKKKARIIISAFCITMPFVMGITRVYFGVHFLTDVVSGWALGAFIAIIGFRIYRRFAKR